MAAFLTRSAGAKDVPQSPDLEFLEFLALHIAHVPLMMVATARPELFVRRVFKALAITAGLSSIFNATVCW